MGFDASREYHEEVARGAAMAQWTPEQGEHYRLEVHRHAEEAAKFQEALEGILRELEGDTCWTRDRWVTAADNALGIALRALGRE